MVAESGSPDTLGLGAIIIELGELLWLVESVGEKPPIRQVFGSEDGNAGEEEEGGCGAEEGIVPFGDEGAARVRVPAGVYRIGVGSICWTGRGEGHGGARR